jgi:signal transduction histidine kinase/CheY-like chemotaxis protein
MTANGRDSPAGQFGSTSALPLYLDPAEVEQHKRQRARRLNVVSVPATRLGGFIALLVLVYLDQRLVVGTFSRGPYLRFAGVLLGWAFLSWLLLYLFYDRLGTHLAFVLLLGDLPMFALVVYATGAEKSWLFFILVVRSADTGFLTARQRMLLAHASVVGYVGLLAWLAAVDGRSLDWPAEAIKIATLWAVCLYLAFTRSIVAELQAQTAGAVRVARDLARRLEEAWRHAEMLSAAKSRFLATMSHELRAPLHAIIGSAHLVQDTGLTAEHKRYFTAISVSAQGLLYTVNQILDFFRVEAGKIDVERVAFLLRQALEGVVQSLSIGAEGRGLDLTCCVDDDVPNAVVGDVGRLRQVLINLVDNGLKFTERGGVSIGVRVAARRPDGVSLRFAVTDTGLGIRPEDQSLIFEAFAQAPMPVDRAKGGTGLGLAIASELVRRLGGHLQVESALGRGSSFHFTLDFALGEPDGAGELPAAATARMADAPGSARGGVQDDGRVAAHGAGRRLQVLVVEDDPLNAEVARAALERGGHAVVVAQTGSEAIVAFDRESFDAVLIDVQLPDVDGLTTAAQFRDRERRGRGRTRIIALTASAAPGDRERCLAAGIDAYLAKPVDPRTLLGAVEALPRQEENPFLADLDGDTGTAIRIARLFLTEAPRHLSDIRAAMAQRDRAALVWAAHRLKGAIANFHASAALDAAGALEAMVGRDGSAGAPTPWEAIEGQVGRLTVAVAELLERIGQVE